MPRNTARPVATALHLTVPKAPARASLGVRGLRREYDSAVQGMIIGCLFHCSRTGRSVVRTVIRWPWGRPQRVGWTPCLCAAAREGAERGTGMGHLWIWCGACHEEGRETMLYEPPHDPAHRDPGPWRPSR
jgi:hypothetical protein